MLRKLGWSALLGLSVSSFGQNLLTNGGFEAYTALPNTYSQICNSNTWTTPSGFCSLVVGCGSPEYYNSAGTGGAGAPATFWATVMPHSGNGFAGFAPWYVGSPTFREYIRVGLSAPMVVGQTYMVSFWLTNGISTLHPYGISRLGFAFSTTPLVQSCGSTIAYTPQIEIPQVVYSTTWQQFSYIFTPTQPFQYLCIGNFVPYASTVSALVGSSGSSGSYYYIDDIVVQPSTPLPIELLRFNAGLIEGERAVRCSWATASEQNSDHFEVQRSSDGVGFETIGELPAAGASTVQLDYDLIDQDPLLGQSYYRLNEVDVDGQETYSDVRSVLRQVGSGSITAWPMEAGGGMMISWSSNDPGTMDVEVLDMEGRLVQQLQLQTGVGVAITGLPAGCYIVRTADPAVPARRIIIP